MGRGTSVVCEKCGWDEQFSFGSGFLSFDNPEDFEDIASGKLGELAKRALDGANPELVHLRSELETFSCMGCGELIRGRKITAYIEDDLPITLYDCDKTCPKCGESPLGPGGVLRPADVSGHIERLVKQGCPNCGGELKKYSYFWD